MSPTVRDSQELNHSSSCWKVQCGRQCLELPRGAMGKETGLLWEQPPLPGCREQSYISIWLEVEAVESNWTSLSWEDLYPRGLPLRWQQHKSRLLGMRCLSRKLNSTFWGNPPASRKLQRRGPVCMCVCVYFSCGVVLHKRVFFGPMLNLGHKWNKTVVPRQVKFSFPSSSHSGPLPRCPKM